MKCIMLMSFLLPLLLCSCQAAEKPVPETEKPSMGDTGPSHPASAADPTTAEYALRWITPSTTEEAAAAELQAVIAQLQDSVESKQAPEREAFTVTYYDVPAQGWPKGYNASLRKRQKVGKENFEVNYKVRGQAPLPSPFPAVETCISAAVEQERETDIAIASQHAGNRENASINCEAKSKDGIPEALRPAEPGRPCTIRMTRHTLKWDKAPPSEKKELKVEYWTFRPPAADRPTRALIEVSWKSDSANDDAEQAFRNAVAPLSAKSPDRLPPAPPPGKEQTALACDANWSI